MTTADDALTAAYLAEIERLKLRNAELDQEIAELRRLAKTVDGLRNVFGVKS